MHRIRAPVRQDGIGGVDDGVHIRLCGYVAQAAFDGDAVDDVAGHARRLG